jgi:hypothetical protein
MARLYDQNGFDDRPNVDRSTLSTLALLFGWLGSHKFYVGSDMLGAVYFTVFVLGLVLTLYEPIWITVFGLTINFAVIIMLLPLIVSVIEFFNVRRLSDGQLYHFYRATGESLTLVFVAQFIYLILLVIPAIARIFSA